MDNKKVFFLHSAFSKASTFGAKSGVDLSSTVISRRCFVDGGTYTASGGLVALNGGSFVSSVVAESGDYIRAKATSSNEYVTSVYVTVSGPDLWSDTFTATTRAEVLAGWSDLKYFTDGEYFTY